MINVKLKKIETGIEKKLDTSEDRANSQFVFLALGSNLNSKFGSRVINLEIAKLLLISNGVEIVDSSSYYESLSYPLIKDPKFINCVIKARTKLTPIQLIKKLLKIEKFIGRIKKKKNTPRVCDIDIIDFKGLIINNKKSFNLTIPHKLAHKRSFVLFPLLEISSKWRHPKLLINIKQLINSLKVIRFNYIKKI